MKWCMRLDVAMERCPIVFQGHPSNCKVTRLKKFRFWPKLGVSGLYLQFEFTNGYEMMHKAWSSKEEVPYCFSRSSVNCKVTRLKKLSILTQTRRFWTVTPVWIHQWLQNDAQTLKQHRRGALLFFKVIRQIAKSRLKKWLIFTQIGRFWTVTPIWIHQWLRNDAYSLKLHRRDALLLFKVIRQIARSHGSKNCRFLPKFGVSGLYL